MQMGNFSTGYFTVAIAVHTFNSPRYANAPICHHLSVNDRDRLALYHPYRQVGLPLPPREVVLKRNLAVIPFFIKLSEGYIYGAGVIACGVRSSYPQLQFIFHILPVRKTCHLFAP